jgi:two-component system KDP operon response regulator KdpE
MERIGRMNRTHILIVDDDTEIVEYLRETLQQEGWDTEAASTGYEALTAIRNNSYDLVILDLLLPGIDGFEVCGKVREFSTVPIMALSGLTSESDKVRCLELGADEYVNKPVGAMELIARIKALMRRIQQGNAVTKYPAFYDGHLHIDFETHRVTLDFTKVPLTKTEYTLLRELVHNAGKSITYQELLQKVWSAAYRDETQYVHVYIRRLRRKIESDPENPRYILNVHGVGYQFKPTGS